MFLGVKCVAWTVWSGQPLNLSISSVLIDSIRFKKQNPVNDINLTQFLCSPSLFSCLPFIVFNVLGFFCADEIMQNGRKKRRGVREGEKIDKIFQRSDSVPLLMPAGVQSVWPIDIGLLVH